MCSRFKSTIQFFWIVHPKRIALLSISMKKLSYVFIVESFLNFPSQSLSKILRLTPIPQERRSYMCTYNNYVTMTSHIGSKDLLAKCREICTVVTFYHDSRLYHEYIYVIIRRVFLLRLTRLSYRNVLINNKLTQIMRVSILVITLFSCVH